LLAATSGPPARRLRQQAKPGKSRWPARLDLLQSLSGLLLALFLMAHMAFVSSILISHDAFYTVARFFEGAYFLGKPYPILVSGVVAGVLALFIGHAWLALRKFPAGFRQYRAFVAHKNRLRHGDTSLWWLQVWTGFALFFMATVHLYQMLMNPSLIGPYESADRVWTGNLWPLYLLLLFAAELHASVGLYRLALKWGWFDAAIRTAAAAGCAGSTRPERLLHHSWPGDARRLHRPRPGPCRACRRALRAGQPERPGR
jgi:fumarate reductase subunit C